MGIRKNRTSKLGDEKNMTISELDERTKKIEREIKWHWRILDIFLFLNIIAFLHYQILPLIIH